jgi:hypothetical protein
MERILLGLRIWWLEERSISKRMKDCNSRLDRAQIPTIGCTGCPTSLRTLRL